MQKTFPKPKIFASKCLGFAHCRYNAETIPNEYAERLKPFVEYVTNCPEHECGMGTPREPIRIIRNQKEEILYQPTTGKKFTSDMKRFIDDLLNNLGEIDGFILKHRSPSCGVYNAKVYASKKANTHTNGPGFFGKRVIEKYPGSPIEDEGRLKNFTIRENFYIKIFTMARFREIKQEKKISSLTNFHAENKFLFMGFDQEKMRSLGLIAANKNLVPIGKVLNDYETVLKRLLGSSPKETSWINVLTHVYGFFKKDISDEEKTFFHNLIEEYRDERIPLSAILKVLESWAIKNNTKYIKNQSLFQPFPRKLVEISDSGKGRSKGRS